MTEGAAVEARSPREEIAALRRRVTDNPVKSIDEVIAFVRDQTLSKSLHVEGILALRKLQGHGQPDAEALGAELLRLLDRAEQVLGELSAEETEYTQTRMAARKELRGRPIDARVALSCRGLGKKYPEFHLRDVDLDLRLGEITGLVGANANGKTTLFRLLVGEVRHSEGELTFPELGQTDTARIDWAAVHMGLAYVPQSLTAWPGSLEDNLRFAAASHGVLGKENDRAFEYIVERLDLGDYLARPWTELSGGFQLRFELARALIWHPKILVLDEPLANLDFRAQWTLLRDIRRLSRSFSDPIAVIISSQHLHEIEALADKIMFLRQGEVKYYGPSDEVGGDRTENTFELMCDAELSQALSSQIGKGVRSIRYDGMSYVVTTSVSYGARDLLERLLQSGCTPRYFRDISNSVKRLFDPPARSGGE